MDLIRKSSLYLSFYLLSIQAYGTDLLCHSPHTPSPRGRYSSHVSAIAELSRSSYLWNFLTWVFSGHTIITLGIFKLPIGCPEIEAMSPQAHIVQVTVCTDRDLGVSNAEKSCCGWEWVKFKTTGLKCRHHDELEVIKWSFCRWLDVIKDLPWLTREPFLGGWMDFLGGISPAKPTFPRLIAGLFGLELTATLIKKTITLRLSSCYVSRSAWGLGYKTWKRKKADENPLSWDLNSSGEDRK